MVGRIEKPECGECFFWCRDIGSEFVGRCHMRPPIETLASKENEKSGIYNIFTTDNHWCGQWRDAEPPYETLEQKFERYEREHNLYGQFQAGYGQGKQFAEKSIKKIVLTWIREREESEDSETRRVARWLKNDFLCQITDNK